MNQRRYRDTLIRFFNQLVNHHRNVYTLVVTFPENTTDEFTEASTKHLLHLLNQKIYGRRYEQYDRYVEGVITRERQLNGCMHYNMLIVGHKLELPDYDEMYSLLVDSIGKLKKFSFIKKSCTGRKLIGCDSWKFQSYYSTDSFDWEDYITKNFNDVRHSLQTSIDSFGFIKGRDLTFGSDCLESFYNGSLRGFYKDSVRIAMKVSHCG